MGAVQPRFLGGLTKRQLEIALFVAQGFQDKEIGEKLFIAAGTVKRHLGTVYELLGLRNRYELIAWAFRNKLVT